MTPESFLSGKVTLHRGDCLEVLLAMESCSVDSCVTDPPYHLTSIVKRFGADNAFPRKEGKTGAYARASRGFMGKQWDGGDIAFRPETWATIWRVLKPGAFICAFSSSRTFGRMSVALEDAGFITHPLIAWVFAQGFPKATRVHLPEWEGWRYGTQALKPALEPIYVGQKPFEYGLTGTQNIGKWGVGAINIDGCRVATAETWVTSGELTGGASVRDYGDGLNNSGRSRSHSLGRWPANLIHDGSEEVAGGFPESKAGTDNGERGTGGIWSASSGIPCGPQYGDVGSAARFFYTAKADQEDRLGSKHPTVKPLDLIQYLARLVTPRGGTILDPFAGTGTCGEASFREGFNSILIEREPEYQADIVRRMGLVLAGPDQRRAASVKQDDSPLPLFGSVA